jgi:hypothetical protein
MLRHYDIDVSALFLPIHDADISKLFFSTHESSLVFAK